jgi:hypothetical protein
MNQPAFDPITNAISNPDNLALALIGGAAAALAGAALWAVITVVTGYQIGWMAIGVGFLVGMTVRKLGNGSSVTFGIAGALLSLAGCLGGNLLALVGFIAQAESASFFATLNGIEPAFVGNLMVQTAGPMDLLFYAFAVYEGFKLSIARPPSPSPSGSPPP